MTPRPGDGPDTTSLVASMASWKDSMIGDALDKSTRPPPACMKGTWGIGRMIDSQLGHAPSTTRRRRTRCAAILLAALVGPTAACSAASSSSTTSATSPAPPAASYADAPCPSPNFPGVPQLELDPTFRCGYLTVPENHAAPNGRTIKIAVARVKATSPNPKPDPLVYLNGGPGGTAVGIAPILVKEGINRDRDVVFVDQRGTLHADPFLSCPEIDTALLEITGLSVLTPTAEQRDLTAVRTCRDRLAGAGEQLSAYDTTENSADIAALRVALGIDQWNVYGVSYGTDLALQLLRDHPQGIRSVVLDSLVPPQTNIVNQLWPSAAEGYRALFDACAAQPACKSAYPNLDAEFTETVNRLAEHPLSVELPATAGNPARHVVIDGYTLANLVAFFSLIPGSYPGLPALIHHVASGDGTDAAKALLGTLAPPGLTSYGLQDGVVCREGAAFTDPATIAAAGKHALPGFPDPVLARPPQLPYLPQECPIWNVGAAPPSAHAPARSNVPALLLAGTFDAVTPPSQADEAARTLSNARVERFPGIGHDVFRASECARSITASFLVDPTHIDTSCLPSVTVPTFTTD
jgi:pimeloyl-ACP methyl ester carboxylesterase